MIDSEFSSEIVKLFTQNENKGIEIPTTNSRISINNCKLQMLKEVNECWGWFTACINLSYRLFILVDAPSRLLTVENKFDPTSISRIEDKPALEMLNFSAEATATNHIFSV